MLIIQFVFWSRSFNFYPISTGWTLSSPCLVLQEWLASYDPVLASFQERISLFFHSLRATNPDAFEREKLFFENRVTRGEMNMHPGRLCLILHSALDYESRCLWKRKAVFFENSLTRGEMNMHPDRMKRFGVKRPIPMPFEDAKMLLCEKKASDL